MFLSFQSWQMPPFESVIAGPIIMREVIPREVERSRHVSLFEERRRPGITDEGTFALDG